MMTVLQADNEARRSSYPLGEEEVPGPRARDGEARVVEVLRANLLQELLCGDARERAATDRARRTRRRRRACKHEREHKRRERACTLSLLVNHVRTLSLPVRACEGG